MKTLIIDRNEWRRGKLAGKNETNYNSKLLCPNTNTKCCLGFLALSCGYTEDQILDKCSPESIGAIYSINKVENLWPREICEDSNIEISNYWFTDTVITNNIIKINDSKGLKEQQREEKLKELFASINIDLQFIN
jgi:hypothetical protein